MPRSLLLLLVLAMTAGCGNSHAAVRPTPAAPGERSSGTQLASPSPSSPTPSRTPSSTPSEPSPASWSLVALGDSVTAGSACGCTAFPDLYAAGLQRRYGAQVQPVNDGVPGQTSGQLLDELLDRTSDPARQVATADIVVTTIGANDFADHHDPVTQATCGSADQLACIRDELSQLRTTLPRLLAQIRSLRQDRPTAVLVTGYWNVFEDGDVARPFGEQGRAATDALTEEVNAAEEQAAAQYDATYVDLFTPFRGADGDHDASPLLAGDGDHPNAAGHRAIAASLLTAGLRPLR